MGASDSFDNLMGRLHARDQRAAAEVFGRYAGRLIALARTRLDARLRSKVDPEDVLQSVFRSFFRRQAAGQFELEDWDDLWSLLVRITLRKSGRTAAAFHAERRDIRKELSRIEAPDDSCCPYEALARDPGPDEVVAVTDMVENLMRRFGERQRHILVLRLQGYTIPEISQEAERTERTVHRVLAEARDILRIAIGEPMPG